MITVNTTHTPRYAVWDIVVSTMLGHYNRNISQFSVQARLWQGLSKAWRDFISNYFHMLCMKTHDVAAPQCDRQPRCCVCFGVGGGARVPGAELKKRLRYMIFKKSCKDKVKSMLLKNGLLVKGKYKNKLKINKKSVIFLYFYSYCQWVIKLIDFFASSRTFIYIYKNGCRLYFLA